MANNKAIQILRGSKNYDPSSSEEELLDGQLFYSKKTKKLYIGDGVTELKYLQGTDIGLDLENGESTGSLQQKSFDDEVKNPKAIGLGSIAFGGFRGDKPSENPIAFDPATDKWVSGLGELDDTTTYVEGIQATSFGAGNRVYGNWNFVVGKDNKTTSRGSFAFGGKNYVGYVWGLDNYSYSMAVGSGNNVLGEREFVTGSSNDTTQIKIGSDGVSYIGGFANIVSGEKNQVREEVTHTSINGYNNYAFYTHYSTISGNQNNAQHARGAALFGNNNRIIGTDTGLSDAIVAGNNNIAGAAQGVVVFGSNNKANHNYQTVIGKYNDNNANNLFEIGNGESEDERSNAFSVTSDGKVIADTFVGSLRWMKNDNDKYVEDTNSRVLGIIAVREEEDKARTRLLVGYPGVEVGDAYNSVRVHRSDTVEINKCETGKEYKIALSSNESIYNDYTETDDPNVKLYYKNESNNQSYINIKGNLSGKDGLKKVGMRLGVSYALRGALLNVNSEDGNSISFSTGESSTNYLMMLKQLDDGSNRTRIMDKLEVGEYVNTSGSFTEYTTIDSTGITCEKKLIAKEGPRPSYPTEDANVCLRMSDILDILYPVGSLYITVSITFNPNTAFGGTWEVIKDAYLYSSGIDPREEGVNTSTVGNTFGNYTITEDQLPDHTHENSITVDEVQTNKAGAGTFYMLGAQNEFGRPDLVYTDDDNKGCFEISSGSTSSTSIYTIEVAEEKGKTASAIKLSQHSHWVTPSVSLTNVSVGGDEEFKPKYLACIVWRREA